MAAPADLNNLNISGKYNLNKKLSDDTDPVLVLQGIGWITRKGISVASISLSLKHQRNNEGVEQIDIKQVASSVIQNSEQHILDYTARPHNDIVFGAMQIKDRRVKKAELENSYLKADWLASDLDHGFIVMHAESDTPKSGRVWTIEQVWGFSEIDGEKRLVRRAHAVGAKTEVVDCRFVYDYVGPVDL